MNLSWIHLGGLFPTPLYHPALAGAPPEEGNWNYLGGYSRRRSTTYIPVGVHPCRREHAAVKMRFPPCFKISDLRHRFWRHVPVPYGTSDSI